MKIGLAADHAGLELKNEIASLVAQLGHDVVDFGAKDYEEGDDYPDRIAPLAEAMSRSEIDRAIAICGSGVGACIVCNKFPGVRAGICHDTYSAHQGVEHDDMNVLVLGSRIVGLELARDLCRAYLAASFSHESRHERRLGKVKAIEARFIASTEA